MQTTNFQRGKVLLTGTITTAVFFTSLILLDYLKIETHLVTAMRELLLIPSFLMMLTLPILLLISIFHKGKYNKKQLLFALIIWSATLLLMVIKTFFLPG